MLTVLFDGIAYGMLLFQAVQQFLDERLTPSQ
jgi:hypothetical protein